MATYEIRITANDGTQQAFKAIAASADKMGDSVEKAGAKAEKGFKGIGDGATKLGAAFGTAVSAASLVGQAYVTQERQLDALARQYGTASDEIIAFTEEIQNSTRYSNDAARESASIAATLSQQYGLSVDQVEQLIARSADLAQSSGLALADAVQRTSSAIRGEAESAEVLGLALNDANVARYAAAQGITNYSTGLDEASRAQLRYQLFLEQSVFAQGAAGAAAQTAGGQAQQFANQVQDAGQALGGFLGPVGEVAANLGQYALIAPLAGAGLGKVATGAKTAASALAALRIGGLAVGAALGPIGLAAVGIGAVGLGFKALVDNANDAREAVQNVGDALALAANNPVNFDQITKLTADINRVLTSQLATETNLDIQVGNIDIPLGPFRAAQGAVEQIFTNIFDQNARTAIANDLSEVVNYAFVQSGENSANVIAELNRLNASFDPANPNAYRDGIAGLAGQLDTFGLVTFDAAGNIVILGNATQEAAAGVDLLTYSLLDGNDAASEFDMALVGIKAAAARFGTGEVAGIKAYITALEEIRALQLAQGTPESLAHAAETTAVIGEATAALDQAYQDQSRVVASGLANVNAVSRQAQEEERAIGEARVASAMALADSYRSALGQSADVPLLAGLEDMVAVGDITAAQAARISDGFQQIAASGASTLEVVVGFADALGYAGTEAVGFASELYGAVDATQGVLGLYSAIDSLGTVLSTAAGIANDLFGEGGDAFDGIGPLVDMLANGTISQTQFNEAVAAGTQIQADNTRGQESLNAVRANLLPLLADQTTELANYYETLANGSDVEQQRALYLADTANQQQVLTLANAAYSASIGEIPPAVVTTLIADAANADPILKQTLIDMGLIEEGADGTITVNFPDGESMTTTITTLNDTLTDLVGVLADIAGQGDPFGPAAAGAAKLAGIDFSNLKGLGPKVEGVGAAVAALGAGRGRPGDGITGYNPGGNGIGGAIPAYRPEHGQTNTTQPGAFPGAGAPQVQTITVDYVIDYVANTGEAVAAIGSLDVLTAGLTDGAHYVVVDSDVTQAQSDLAGVEGQVRVLDESGATVYLGADDAQAVRAMTDVEGQIRVIDTATGTVYVYGDVSDAQAGITDIGAQHKGLDGQRATLFQDGDNSDAVGKVGEAAAALAGVNGTSALLYANGDSSGAENAAAVGAAAVIGVDGTSANLYVNGIDNYSGVIAAAGALAGAVLATTYVDTVYRSRKEIGSYFADGGVVGYANGGIPAAANGLVLVGENGPELARLPGGTLITPAPATRAALSGGGGGGQSINLYNYGSINGIEDIAGFIYDGLAQAAAMERASMGGG